MPAVTLFQANNEAKIFELKKKIEDDAKDMFRTLYLENVFACFLQEHYKKHNENSLLNELIDDIKDVQVHLEITYNTVDKKTEIIDELKGYVGEDAELAFEWCEDNKEDLIQEGKKQIKEFGSDALDQMSCDISDYLDEYLFEDQGGFLSSVGFCGPSEDYDLRCCAGVWIQHNKDLIVKTNS